VRYSWAAQRSGSSATVLCDGKMLLLFAVADSRMDKLTCCYAARSVAARRCCKFVRQLYWSCKKMLLLLFGVADAVVVGVVAAVTAEK